MVYGVLKRRAVGHNRRARDDSVAETPNYSRIDSPRVAEVVGIDDQSLHAIHANS